METNQEQQWSSTRYKTINFLGQYLKDQVRVRYAMYDRPKSGLSNIIIDSFIPRLLVANNMNQGAAVYNANLPRTAVAINPWFSDMFGIKQMEIEQLCRILGYDKKYLKDLFKKVKNMEWSVTFAGLGGTGQNTIHWLTEIAKMTNIINLFNHINTYENENLDISNLFRIPKNTSKFISDNKTKTSLVLNDIEYLSKNKADAHDVFLYKDTMKSYFNKPNEISIEYLYNEERDDYGSIKCKIIHNKKRHVIYGAPDIHTRQWLSENISHFVSATHGSNDFSLVLNPTQNTSLQVESYGMIQLAQFFMNQLHMAISFMEFLATDPDLNEQNKIITEGSFNGERKLKCDREYNFQLDFDGMMIDENQVNDI